MFISPLPLSLHVKWLCWCAVKNLPRSLPAYSVNNFCVVCTTSEQRRSQDHVFQTATFYRRIQSFISLPDELAGQRKHCTRVVRSSFISSVRRRQIIAWPWVRGRSRSLKMAPFDRSHRPTTYYQSAIVTSFILYHFRDKARHWPKISIFNTPLAFDALVRGRGSPSEYCYAVWYGKTRIVWLPDGEKSLMNSRLDRIPACLDST